MPTIPRMKRPEPSVDKIEGLKKKSRKQTDDHIDPSGSGSEEEEEDRTNDPSVFNNLLEALGSGRKDVADLYKRRLREQEGRSDTEEDEDGSSESASVPEDGGEDDSGSSLGDAEENNANEYGPTEWMEHNEDEASDGVGIHGQAVINERESTSSFHVHLGHILTIEEIDEFNKKKWRFEWEMPGIGMSKWVGTGEKCVKVVGSDLVRCFKKKLYNHWVNIYRSSGINCFDSSRQGYFLQLCNSYRDIMHCNKKPFYQRGIEEDSSIMDAYIMHALNHVYHTRDFVTKNGEKLNKHQESKPEEILHVDSFRDQGFTRPKIMFLLPLRSIALRLVKRLIQLTPLKSRANVEYMDRFVGEFDASDGEDEDAKNDNGSKSRKPAKPVDFQVLFGGNIDDHFMIGIKLTKGSVKLYSDFYSSDIIVASPLGLITKIGEAEVEKEKDVDYLSSLEIVIIDHADVIAMQNWSHVNTVFEQLNRMPSKQHGTDIMRIRPWYLDGRSHFYRQTIILGSFLNPEINALFNQLCFNYEGKVKLISEYKGVLPKVILQVRQVYERFDATSIVDADDARLDYFMKKVFPKIKDSIEGGTMLFISSYFEFVRIRNFLKSQNASFCLCGEYTKQSDISRARLWFFEGKRKIMLYTERAHFYHRYKISGIQNLIVYSLPERKEFYPEIINMLDGSTNMMCNVLFSRFDLLRLERIVGSSTAKRMLSSDKGLFVFC